MKYIIILIPAVLLLIVSACSSASDDIAEETTTTDQDSIQDTAGDIAQEAEDITDEVHNTADLSCEDECEQITAWCQEGTFYACVQKECKEIIEVKDCPTDACKNTIFCSDGETGIMVLDQFLGITNMKQGAVGVSFSLTISGEKMMCTSDEIVKDQMIMKCE